MFSAPAVTPVRAAARQKNGLIYSVAGITCIGVSIFLVAATIVVALIPIYMANRAAAVDTQKFLTKEALVYVPINEVSTRRRRQSNTTTGLESYVGAEGGPIFRGKVAQTLLNKMDATVVQEVLINSMLVRYKNDGRRKRWGLVKRETRVIILIIRFQIRFRTTQSQNQQNAAVTVIRTKITETFSEAPTLTSVDIYRNGELVATITTIQFSAPTYISDIISAASPSTIGSTPTTGQPTVTAVSTTVAAGTTTTTAMTTTVASTTTTVSTTTTTTATSVTPVMPG